MFAQAVVAHANLKKAAEIAGYGGKHVGNHASRLAKEPAVKARIMEISEQLCAELKITQRDVLSEYSRIAFLDGRRLFDEHGEILPLNDLPTDVAHAVAGYKITRKKFGDGEDAMETEEKEIKLVSKTDALAKLSQHLQLFKDGGAGGSITAEEMLAVMLAARNRALSMRRPEAIEYGG